MDLYGEIDARATILTEDNFEAVKRHMASNAGDEYAKQHLLELIKSAMNIGASVMLERGVPELPGEVVTPMKPTPFEEEMEATDRWLAEQWEKNNPPMA